MQNSQENICAGIPFLVFSREFCEIFKTSNLKNICERLLLKISSSVTNLRTGVILEFYYTFKVFSILNFNMRKCFFSSQTWYFYHTKVVLQYTSSELFHFIILEIIVEKFEFDTDLFLESLRCKKWRIPVYLTKAVLKRTSNSLIKMKNFDLDES